MPLRVGPGPVFVYEFVAGARRWQMFGQRVALIVLLFGTLTIVWATQAPNVHGQHMSLANYAELGQSFASAVLGVQLALILLAAPAATAGAVCLDKARGNLELMLVTHLTNVEIVLGKICARLIPIFGLVIASLPVLFIAGIMGGVAWEFLLGGFIVLIGAVVVSAALAFVFSVWVGKTHEALMLAYFILFVWLLLYLTFELTGVPPTPKEWAFRINPYALLYAPTEPSWNFTLADYGIYLALTFGVSALIVLFAIWRIRRVVLAQRRRRAGSKRSSRFAQRWRQRVLDRNPLRWYEKHRRKPTRAGRVIAWLYGVAAIAGTIWAIWSMESGWMGNIIGFMVALLQVLIGLLLITIGATTALVDERVRGNLDILLVTPLSTRYIVFSKWRAAMARVPRIIALPILILVVDCVWQRAIGGRRTIVELTILAIPYLFAAAAFLVTLGLFLATWLRQFGRAVGTAVTIYVGIALIWPMLVAMVVNDSGEGWYAICASPAAVIVGAAEMDETQKEAPHAITAVIIWTLLYGFGSLLLYWLTRRIFDRSFGRITKVTGVKKAVSKRKVRRGLGVEWVEPRGLP